MFDLSTFVFLILAALAFAVIPGPAVIYITTRSMDQGRAAGLASVLGIAVGSLIHAGAATVGLSAILASSALAFTVVKTLGATYLIYLGVVKLLARETAPALQAPQPRRLRRVFLDGIIVNLFNPKTALFFLAFLPQFVNPARGAVAVQTMVLGLTVVLIALLSDSCYALVAARLSGWVRTSDGAARFRRLAGGVYVTLGVLALAESRR